MKPAVPDAAVDTAGPEAEPPDATMEAPAPAAFSDRCEGIPALMSSDSISLDIDTTKLKGDYSELVACVGHELPGNDGFVAVDMMAGDKWHVHVNPAPGMNFDPAVYILASCDERACSKVLIFRPVCGNGANEHSETCDDKNTTSGDGCDSLCRKELSAATVTEAEPNDDPRAANVLAVAGRPGGITVMGIVASRCDHDMYSVTLPATGTIRATVSATTLACGAEGATVSLALIGADGQTAVNGATSTLVNDCPMLAAKDLPAGEYGVVIRRSPGEMSWPYQVLVEAP
jgi:cysteine-rich repeat protein